MQRDMKYFAFIFCLLATGNFVSAVRIANESGAPISQSTAAYEIYIQKIEDFFNKTRQFSAQFIQTDQNNHKSYGYFLIKNKKLKLEYTNPETKVIIIKNNSVIIYDKNLHEKTKTSVYSSPFSFLLKANVKLREYMNILNISDSATELSVVLSTKNEDSSTIVLQFSKEPFMLKGWELLNGRLPDDANYYATKIELQNHNLNPRISDKEFNEYD